MISQKYYQITHVAQYADDIAIWVNTTLRKHTNKRVVNHVQKLYQSEINKLTTYMKDNGFELPREKMCLMTGPRSAVVSASDCGSEGLGFESHQSHVGFFGPGRLLPRAGSAMGPVGRLEPHSRASST